MSTTTAAITNTANQANVSLIGAWPVASGGRISPYATQTGEFQFAFTGNRIDLRVEGNGITTAMYIDGVLTSLANAIPGISRAYNYVNIWNGAEGNHTCRLVFSGQVEIPVSTTAVLITSSGTATISMNGFAGYSVANSGSTGISPYTDNNDSSPLILLEGHFRNSSLGGVTDQTNGLAAAFGIRFKSKCSKISVFVHQTVAKLMLSVDGIDRQVTYVPAGSGFTEIVVGDGLDAFALHEYVIKQTQGGTHIQSVQVYNDTLITPLTARPVWAFYGDSITAGSIIPIAGIPHGLGLALDEWISYCHTFAEQNGRNNFNCGQPSTTVIDYTGHTVFGGAPNGFITTYAMSGTTRIAMLPSNAEIVWINGGFNDAGTIPNTTSTVVTISDFQSAYLLMLNRILAQCGTAKLMVMSIWPSRANADANHTASVTATYNAAIVAAIAACNAPSRCTYISTDTWYDSTIAGTTLSDAVHPVYNTYVNQIVPKLQALVSPAYPTALQIASEVQAMAGLPHKMSAITSHTRTVTYYPPGTNANSPGGVSALYTATIHYLNDDVTQDYVTYP